MLYLYPVCDIIYTVYPGSQVESTRVLPVKPTIYLNLHFNLYSLWPQGQGGYRYLYRCNDATQFLNAIHQLF
jgi:hypothetical protein